MRLRYVVACALACSPVVVLAGYVDIQSPPGNEQSIQDVLSARYGGSFSLSGDDFVGHGPSSGLSAVRFDDYLSPNGVLDLTSSLNRGDVADSVWRANELKLEAVALYSSQGQRLGIDRGAGHEWLFDVTGSGFNVTGDAQIDLMGDSFVWVRDNGSGGSTVYSDISRNSDGLEHMVTFRIDGLHHEYQTWVIAFEDWKGPNSDRDFNDLLVEVRVVPEPASITLSALGLLSLLRRR